MAEGQRLNLKKTRDIRNPHEYILAVHGECQDWVLDEEQAPKFRGKWASKIFQNSQPIDLEIGTGNGFFFAKRSGEFPNRNLIGIEVKFKPLIQAVRRAYRQGSRNMRMLRYDGAFVDDLFLGGEIQNVFIHHPDPWHKTKKQKKRLMQTNFLNRLFSVQSPGSELEFKTDSREYFLWAVENIKKTPYDIDKYTLDLHGSSWFHPEDLTHFERLFAQKNIPINYLTLRVP